MTKRSTKERTKPMKRTRRKPLTGHKKHGQHHSKHEPEGLMLPGKYSTHGAYLQRYDKRTREGIWIMSIERALCTQLGGEPSPAEVIIIQRASVKALRCALAERELLTKKMGSNKHLEDSYLRWSAQLRSDLQTLGMKRRPRAIKDLALELVRED